MNKEFYSRDRHEQVLKDIDEYKEIQEGVNDMTEDERIVIENEERMLQREHELLLNRAWIEAQQENRFFDSERSLKEHAEESERQFVSEKAEFTDFMDSITDPLQVYLPQARSFTCRLPGIAEITIQGKQADKDKPVFNLTLTYPQLKPLGLNIDADADHNEYNEYQANLTISAQGDITGWENAPISLQGSSSGKADTLRELKRCLQELGVDTIPRLFIEDPLMVAGEGETHAPLTMEGPIHPDFAATERIAILNSFHPVFICENYSIQGAQALGEAYKAFVYPDVIIFDSLYYGHAIYFLPLNGQITEEWVVEFEKRETTEKRSMMESLLAQVDFFNEIKRKKPERRARGNRYRIPHPQRPVDPDSVRYKQYLRDYYQQMFEYVRNECRGRLEDNGHQKNAEVVPRRDGGQIASVD